MAGGSSSGLSPGQSAGIAIGVIIAVIALVALALFFVIKHRKERQKQKAGTEYGQGLQPILPVPGATADGKGAANDVDDGSLLMEARAGGSHPGGPRAPLLYAAAPGGDSTAFSGGVGTYRVCPADHVVPA